MIISVRSLTSTHFKNVRSCAKAGLFTSYSAQSRRGLITGRDESSTVIIGGGIVGTSLAYHLALQGEKDVMLLEKAELTAGSTWHAAGLTTSYHPGVNMKKLHYYSLNLYSRIASETGQEVGFHQPGSLRLAFTPDRCDEFKYQMSRQGVRDAPQRLMSPEEVEGRVPLLQKGKVLLGLYSPHDGHIDPYSLTQAIAKAAKKHGADLLQGIEVTSLQLRDDGRWEVGTTSGTVVTQKVINAGGFWAKDVARLAGSDLPLIPVQHQYLVTSSVPEVQALKEEMPVLRHMEGSCYIRQERDGLLAGVYESPETSVACEKWMRNGVPKEFGKELFEPNLERILPYLERVMEDFPSFSRANIQSIVNGPICYSPDGLPLIGPDMLPNMWLAVGFGYGIIHGGGAGKYLADWILNGEPSYDLIECDPGRFSTWITDDYTVSKARESYGMQNSLGYQHEERFAGRPTSRVTPALDLQVVRRGHMQMHAGWEQPAWFAVEGDNPEYKPSFKRSNWELAVERECGLVTQRCGIIDLSPFSKIEVRGKDARRFLNYITANVVPTKYRTVISHMLTPSGRVMAELTVTCLDEDQFLVVTGSGSEIHDLRWMLELSRKEDYEVTIANLTEEMSCLSVAGPRSAAVLSSLSDRFKEKFAFLSADKVCMAGIDTTAIRITYTGELGWEIYHPMDRMKDLYEAILHHGESFGLEDFGTLTLNTLRLEKGFKMWGNEMNLDTNPFEADLGPFVRMSKESFIGKSALERILRQRLQRRLVMISVETKDSDPHGDETIWCEGKAIGNTTSGCFSPHLGRSLAFAYLPPYMTTPGIEVQVELLGDLCPAKVLPGPPCMTHVAKVGQKKIQ